jgi:hypothetical protein
LSDSPVYMSSDTKTLRVFTSLNNFVFDFIAMKVTMGINVFPLQIYTYNPTYIVYSFYVGDRNSKNPGRIVLSPI